METFSGEMLVAKLIDDLLSLKSDNLSNAIEYYHKIEKIESKFRLAKHAIKSEIYSKNAFALEGLSGNELSRLNELNNRCYSIQDELLKTYYESRTEAAAWLFKKSVSGGKDTELVTIITCHIGEEDEAWEEDSDNIAIQFEDVVTVNRLTELGSFAEYGLNLERPHSYLFHSLYDHSSPQMSWRDLLRIRSIWVEVQTWKQLEFEMPIAKNNL